MTILEKIAELKANGNTLRIIKAMLMVDGYTDKEIAEALKTAGVSGKRRTFATEYYEWLSAECRTRVSAELYIMGEGEYGETSKNVKNHLSHYLNIFELTKTIWDNKSAAEDDSADEEWFDNEPEENDEVKSAWDKLKEAKAKWYAGGRKPKRTSFHPDKVSSLGDEELTKAYTEFFQDLDNNKKAA